MFCPRFEGEKQGVCRFFGKIGPYEEVPTPATEEKAGRRGADPYRRRRASAAKERTGAGRRGADPYRVAGASVTMERNGRSSETLSINVQCGAPYSSAENRIRNIRIAKQNAPSGHGIKPGSAETFGRQAEPTEHCGSYGTDQPPRRSISRIGRTARVMVSASRVISSPPSPLRQAYTSGRRVNAMLWQTQSLERT